MRVDIRRSGQPALAHERVTRTPTIQDLIDLATRLGFSATTVRKTPHYAPYMLHNIPYTEGGLSEVLAQFRAGDDPYAYYALMKQVARDHPKTKDAGGWLQSVARLLVCWVAEELRRQGIGNGFHDHFVVHDSRKRVREEEVADTEEEEEEEEDASLHGLVDWYASQMDSDVSPAPAQTNRWTPPPYLVQQARTLALHKPLRAYLETGAGVPAARGRRPINYLRDRCDRSLLVRVRAFLLETDAGLALLDACRVRPDAFTIDHVLPQALGGPHHILNFHVMPPAANSHFGDRHWTDPEKEAYVGSDQIQCVKTLVHEARDALAWNEISITRCW